MHTSPIRERILVPDDGAVSDGGANRRAMTVAGISTLGAREILDVFEGLGAGLERPALALRIRVAVRRRVLDKDLRAATARCAVTCTPCARASSSNDAAASVWQRRLSASSRAPSERHRRGIVWLPKCEILDARTELLSLARRLRDARPIYACGVAMVSQLVCDGIGPAFTPRAGLALRRAIAEATVALEGTATNS